MYEQISCNWISYIAFYVCRLNYEQSNKVCAVFLMSYTIEFQTCSGVESNQSEGIFLSGPVSLGASAFEWGRDQARNRVIEDEKKNCFWFRLKGFTWLHLFESFSKIRVSLLHSEQHLRNQSKLGPNSKSVKLKCNWAVIERAESWQCKCCDTSCYILLFCVIIARLIKHILTRRFLKG